MLFATLDPTLRRVRLPHGTPVILSDTVGFISDLPTHLVAAFRATLEEVVEADLVLHLRDISPIPIPPRRPKMWSASSADLGVDVKDTDRVVEVWNKIDLLDDANRERLLSERPADPQARPVAVSAVTGEGIDRLTAVIEGRVAGEVERVPVELSPAQHHLVDWIYRNGEVISRKDRDDGGVSLVVNMTAGARDEMRGRIRA
jgi:GTP-binding protein HflX